MKIVDAAALLDFHRKTVEFISDLTGVARNLVGDVRDSYRRELCYVRGPGERWRGRYRGRQAEL
jgi:hypothetical protein